MATADIDPLRHWDVLIRVCRPIVDSVEDAEDCAAQVVLQVLSTDQATVRNLEALMISMVKRRAYDTVRAAKRARVRNGKLAKVAVESVVDVAEDVVERAEATWLQATAEAELSPIRQRVIELTADGHDVVTIAKALGLSPRAVEGQLYQARRVLRQLYAKTLPAVVIGLAAVRRSLTPAVPNFALAALLVLSPAFAVGFRPSVGGPITERAVSPLTSDQIHPRDRERTRSVTRRQASTPKRPVRRAQIERLSAEPRTEAVLTIRDPAGRTAVERRETGGSENGPVEVLTACLQKFRVEASHIGC